MTLSLMFLQLSVGYGNHLLSRRENRMKENLIRCDACGKTEAISGSPDALHSWLLVNTAVAPNDMKKIVEALQEGKDAAHLLDTGDFCSLICLANWASSQANLRGLDATGV
jgi:hypothetical protein